MNILIPKTLTFKGDTKYSKEYPPKMLSLGYNYLLDDIKDSTSSKWFPSARDSYLLYEMPTENVFNRAYYKMWEMIVEFNLIDKNKDLKALHLAEAPGAFIQATLEWRDKHAKSKDNDSHYGVTLIDKTSKTKLDFAKLHDRRLKLNITQDTKDTGDLTDMKVIENISKVFKYKADLITSDGGFQWKNENDQEAEAFPLILGEVIATLLYQAKHGNAVIKIFDSVTIPTQQLIACLTAFYEDVYIFKPLTSRASNSERYIICKNFTSLNDASVGTKSQPSSKSGEKISSNDKIFKHLVTALKHIKKDGVHVERLFDTMDNTIMIKSMSEYNVKLSAQQTDALCSIIYKNIKRPDDQKKSIDEWMKKYM